MTTEATEEPKKGVRTFTPQENKAVLEVLLAATEANDNGKPPTALAFLEELRGATKKTFSKEKLFREARRIRSGMAKKGYKLYVPIWRESDDWIKWTEEWKEKRKATKAKK